MKMKYYSLFGLLAFGVLRSVAEAQETIDLGSASNFAVLGGSGITVAGAVDSTTITGDIGSFPTPSITGLTNVVLNGINHSGDAVTQAAQNDAAAAYNVAAGLTPTETYGAIYDLGGLTLAPGVYNDPSSFAVTGILTLDAQGNPNAVWVFQAGSTLTMEANSKVLLINDADADNVYWDVGSSATLLQSSTFAGSLIADTSVTMTSGATVNGGVFALNGAVTLDNNNISDNVRDVVIPEPASTSLITALAVGGMALIMGFKKIRRWELVGNSVYSNY